MSLSATSVKGAILFRDVILSQTFIPRTADETPVLLRLYNALQVPGAQTVDTIRSIGFVRSVIQLLVVLLSDLGLTNVAGAGIIWVLPVLPNVYQCVLLAVFQQLTSDDFHQYSDQQLCESFRKAWSISDVTPNDNILSAMAVFRKYYSTPPNAMPGARYPLISTKHGECPCYKCGLPSDMVEAVETPKQPGDIAQSSYLRRLHFYYMFDTKGYSNFRDYCVRDIANFFLRYINYDIFVTNYVRERDYPYFDSFTFGVCYDWKIYHRAMSFIYDLTNRVNALSVATLMSRFHVYADVGEKYSSFLFPSIVAQIVMRQNYNYYGDWKIEYILDNLQKFYQFRDVVPLYCKFFKGTQPEFLPETYEEAKRGVENEELDQNLARELTIFAKVFHLVQSLRIDDASLYNSTSYFKTIGLNNIVCPGDYFTWNVPQPRDLEGHKKLERFVYIN
ncbi:hypothetical protein 3 [Hubei picorna-like virus 74]|uniref:hypothetical protein 3 n=1 Tax=Hubei picorna-like virus 74 TaxID=1923158 RepID=UPI00090A8F09|nr:hypothetical protein 3 [Hubei picorna-like virus 74]APG78373.1 hypothetical protein 3 [Hubei picorna-like virus 74]